MSVSIHGKNYTIVTPTENRIEDILNLCAAHAEFERAPYHKEQKAIRLASDLWGQDQKLHCKVAVVEEMYVGYITWMKQYSTWDVKEYLYMDCLFLFDEYRGLGIGEELVNTMKEFGRKEDIDLIQWQTPDFNVRAIKFYRRLGASSKSKERFFLTINNS